MRSFRAVVAAALVLLSSAHLPAAEIGVTDGDTFTLDDEIIRIWGIDAPEGRQRCTVDGAEWRCGQASALALEMLLAGREVTCVTEDIDRYGRQVARCTISQGRLDVGSLMVGQGWAFDYSQYSKGRYAREQALAQERKSGIWIGEVEPPWEWRKANR
jgi:endonuclease YncB( thermonuclease family)